MKDRFTWILGWLFALFMILMIGVVSNGYSAPTVAGKSPPGPVATLSSDHMTFIVQSPGLTWQFNLSSLESNNPETFLNPNTYIGEIGTSIGMIQIKEETAGNGSMYRISSYLSAIIPMKFWTSPGHRNNTDGCDVIRSGTFIERADS
jgi:hypothetical protein